MFIMLLLYTTFCTFIVYYLITKTITSKKKPVRQPEFKLLANLTNGRNFKSFTYPIHGNVAQYATELEMGITPDVTPYDQHNYEFIINNKNKCDINYIQFNRSEAAAGNIVSLLPLNLVCLVKSAVPNFEKRKAIRNTWGSENQIDDSVQIRTIFLLGSPTNETYHLQRHIEEENDRFHDILQGDFIDEYYNNTIKTLMALHWAITFCTNGEFYFFVDDDYLVSIENRLVFLSNPMLYPVDYTDTNLTSLINNRSKNLPEFQLNSIGTVLLVKCLQFDIF